MNWDKPLTQKTICGPSFWVKDFNKYHGINHDVEWNELVSLLGAPDRCGPSEFYKAYLNYCSIMSSPLGEALA